MKRLLIILTLAFLFIAPLHAQTVITDADGNVVAPVAAFGPVNFGAEHSFTVTLAEVDINAGRPILAMIPGRDDDPDNFPCTLKEDGGDPVLVTVECVGVNWPDLFSGAGYISEVTISQPENPVVATFAVVVTGDF